MKLQLNRFLVLKIILYSTLIYFIYLLVLITLQYVPINDEVAFLNLKQEEIKLTYYKYAFFLHVYSSILVIIAGITQFSKTLRRQFSYIHKLSGKIYVLLILVLASPSGFIMALHSNGNNSTHISFCILSILWFFFTLKAYLSIKKGNYQQHKNFMIRSYALTLSAISLRLFKYWIVTIFELPPMDTYNIVAILGWTVNLAIAEIIIIGQRYYT